MNPMNYTEIRDKLTMDVLGFRQIIRDMPPQNLAEVAKVLKDAETELLKLRGPV